MVARLNTHCSEGEDSEGDLERLFAGRAGDLPGAGAWLESEAPLTGGTTKFYLDNLWIDGKLH